MADGSGERTSEKEHRPDRARSNSGSGREGNNEEDTIMLAVGETLLMRWVYQSPLSAQYM